jgi:hypothetical protein
MSSKIKLTDAIGKLLSENNRDKTLGEIGEDLSGYLVKIKDMVKSGEITYSVLMEEISKYIERGQIPKPNTVAQLLMGCGEGDEWCPLDESENEVSFYYDSEKNRFVSISEEDLPKNSDTCAVVFLTGNPKDLDISSFEGLAAKGFEKLKIKFKDVSDSIYKELEIGDLEKHIRLNTKSQPGDKISMFMSISFLLVVLIVVYYIRNSYVVAPPVSKRGRGRPRKN